MSTWNFMNPASRDTLLALVQREAEGMFALVGTDEAWTAPTRAGHWEARDVVGHLIDTTETYFIGFAAARGEGSGPASVPLVDMALHVDAGAKALRDIPRGELVARCRRDLETMMGTVGALTDAEWGSLMVPHKYMGPLPAFFYPIFQLVDYSVHSWDIREGTGKPHALAGDSADMLVPLGFVLWSATPKVAPDTAPFQIGIRITSGANAGDSVVSVSPAGVQIAPGAVDGLPAVIEFDPTSFILTAFGRTNCGTIRGDRELAHRFLGGFFPDLTDETNMTIDLDLIAEDRERIRREYLSEATDRPASSARGIHHTALLSSDVRRTIEFYQGLLEFPLTEIFENRDYAGSNHFFFDVGVGNLLAFFDMPGLDLGPYAEVLGGLHHIAISVAKERWDHLRAKLDEAGVPYLVESKTSIYLKGPDGERVELLADPLGEMYGTKVL